MFKDIKQGSNRTTLVTKRQFLQTPLQHLSWGFCSGMTTGRKMQINANHLAILIKDLQIGPSTAASIKNHSLFFYCTARKVKLKTVLKNISAGPKPKMLVFEASHLVIDFWLH